ncbi:MAG: TIGR02679 family protein [Acidimicrobiales bacterium]|jgi:uncharacterized protein (TIGR02679 family)
MDSLGGLGLQPLWRAARRRLESNGLVLGGAPLVLKDLTSEQSDAVAGLLGVRVPADGAAMRVRLELLDEALRRSSIGCGLFEVLSELEGPLIDRRARRLAAEDARIAERKFLSNHPAVVSDQRLKAWLDGIWATGSHRRMARGNEALATLSLRAALDVLALMRQRGDGQLLAVLAADATGDAHALDRGTPVGGLVVHALSTLSGSPVPEDAASWRGAWSDVGITCDDLSCDVLVLNLPDWPSGPWRLTLRQASSWARRGPLPCATDESGAGGLPVFVCENPAVLAAVSDSVGERAAPVVCLDGMPSTAALVVLTALSGAGRTLCYHGDFDWHGLRIAGVLVHKLPGVVPWRYSAEDYRLAIAEGLGNTPLTGRTAASPWDAALGGEMAAVGVAIYEEQVIGQLVLDVGEGSAPMRASGPTAATGVPNSG